MSVEYCPTEEMWAELLTKTLQRNSYGIMISKLMNMPELYVDPDENEPAKGSKATGVFTKEEQIEFNQDVHMRYIPNITGVQTKSLKSDRNAKEPTSSTSVQRSVLAKIRLQKVTDKCNVVNYKKGTDKWNGGNYEKGADKCSDGHDGTCNRNKEQYGTCSRNILHYRKVQNVQT